MDRGSTQLFRINSCYVQCSIMDSNKANIGTSTDHILAQKKQLGLKAEFIYPNHARVTIPTLPYGSIESSSNNVSFIHIMRLFDTIQLAWPLYHTIDSGTSLVFLMNCHLEVIESFYHVDSPKYPLVIDSTTKWAKRSSRLYESVLSHPKNMKPYAKMSCLDVNMDLITKSPTPVPDWWIKYVNCPPGSDSDRRKFRQPIKPLSGVLFTVRRVYFSDTDENKHMNYISYARFCYDFLYETVIVGKYQTMPKKTVDRGLKLLQITFVNECLLGDNVMLELWKDEGSNNTFNFEMRNGSELSAYLTMRFYESSETSNKSLL